MSTAGRTRSLLRRALRARGLHGLRDSAGMTLLEVLVSIAILAMIALLIYGAFDSVSRGKKAEEMRADRAREGREAIQRIVREMSSAFLSMHQPPITSLITRQTAFIATAGSPYDRVDFTAFAHRRYERDSKESDEAEIGFFVTNDPDIQDKYDLVRREQTPIDMYPGKGGVVNVLAENVEIFNIKYLDPQSGLWGERWDTTQTSGQPNRLPLEVRVALTMKAIPGAAAQTYVAKFMMPMQSPLNFGISR
jgi:general secretion pathway protein J